MTFATDYRQHALPLLEAPCRIAAMTLELEHGQFSDAVAAVWTEAARLGASYLPARAVTALLDWIYSRLLTEADAVRSLAAEIEAQAWLEPVAHYDSLSTDPALRWTFAAICPEYRRALLEREAQKRREWMAGSR